MAKNKENFYLAKGPSEPFSSLFYGEEPPVIDRLGRATSAESKCEFVGCFDRFPLAMSMENGEIVKVYIRKATNKK